MYATANYELWPVIRFLWFMRSTTFKINHQLTEVNGQWREVCIDKENISKWYLKFAESRTNVHKTSHGCSSVSNETLTTYCL